jgi:uncharacterized protein (TIGR02270 family)
MMCHRHIIGEHASDAAFLWQQRDRAVGSPLYRLPHLERLDARLQAHLEGLRTAGEPGIDMARRGLADASAATVFVFAYLGFGSQRQDLMRMAFDVARADPRFMDALVAALAWLDPAPLRQRLGKLAASADPQHRRLALAVEAAHRVDSATQTTRAASDPDPALRARALRAIGQVRRRDLVDLLNRACSDDDPHCRFWAGWSLGIMGCEAGAQVVYEAMSADAALERAGIDLAIRAGHAAWARQQIRVLAGHEATRRQSVIAAGAYGDPASVPWLLDLLDDPKLARVAAEAVAMITGVDLDAAAMKQDAPGEQSTRQESLADHPDDAASHWPSPSGLRAWWHSNAQRFAPGSRYLGGHARSADGALQVLRHGYQRQRQAAAIELALACDDQAVFAVAARASLQRRWLSA